MSIEEFKKIYKLTDKKRTSKKKVDHIINEENVEDEFVWVTEIGNQCDFASNDQLNNRSCLNLSRSKEQTESVNKKQPNEYFEKKIPNEHPVKAKQVDHNRENKTNILIDLDNNATSNLNVNGTRQQPEQQTIIEENKDSEQQQQTHEPNCNDQMHSVLINEEQYKIGKISNNIKQKKIMQKSASLANNKFNLEWDFDSLNQIQYMEYTSLKMIKDKVIKNIVEKYYDSMKSKVVKESFEQLQESFNEVLDKLLDKIENQEDTIIRLELDKESILVILKLNKYL